MEKRQQPHVYNGIGHFDVAGPDLGALRSFYASVFSWPIDARGPGYASITTPSGTPSGALVESQEASLTIGIVVADIAGSIDAAIANGGSVAMPLTDNGWVKKAQIADPAGNLLTLIQG